MVAILKAKTANLWVISAPLTFLEIKVRGSTEENKASGKKAVNLPKTSNLSLLFKTFEICIKSGCVVTYCFIWWEWICNQFPISWSKIISLSRLYGKPIPHRLHCSLCVMYTNQIDFAVKISIQLQTLPDVNETVAKLFWF